MRGKYVLCLITIPVGIQVVAVWGKDRVVNPMAPPPAPGATSDATKQAVANEAAPQAAKPDAPADAKPAGTPEGEAPAETSGQAGEDFNACPCYSMCISAWKAFFSSSLDFPVFFFAQAPLPLPRAHRKQRDNRAIY